MYQNMDTSGSSSSEDEGPLIKRKKRVFQQSWLKKYPWLKYEDGCMRCTLCETHRKNNSLVKGPRSFKTTTLMRHAESKQHKDSLIADNSKSAMRSMVLRSFQSQDEAIISSLKTVYFLAKNDIASAKYSDFIDFLQLQGCPVLSSFSSGNMNYRSHGIVKEFQSSIAEVVRNDVYEKLRNADFISLLADESCDITVSKKLCVYARICTNFVTETLFIENVDIPDGKAKTISESLKDVIQRIDLQNRKIIGLGSDGASVMTGKKNGVGVLLRSDINQYMVNIHCIAHRLALVTSQAASSVDCLQKYLETLTSVYYWFKHSAVRTSALSALQEVLDLPQIRIKEVHAVRRFSFYNALEAVYKSFPALAMLLEQSATTEAKAKGILRAVTTGMFVGVTHILMDIIPIMTHLNMVFQKENLDLSIVMPAINGAKSNLQRLTSETGHHESLFVTNFDKSEFKGVKLTVIPNLIVNVVSVKKRFITSILLELDKRFPDDSSALLNSFSALAMRGINFVPKAELFDWCNDKLQSILDWYGEGEEPYVNKEEVEVEWQTAKQLVVDQRYPSADSKILWSILQQQSDVIPNLVKLASISAALPVHTSDVERGFSAQNLAKTSHRNRLTGTNLNDILLIRIQGPNLDEFDFNRALAIFKSKKERRLYSTTTKTDKCS